MITSFSLLVAASALLGPALSAPVLAQAAMGPEAFIKKWDPDKDGTLDMTEVKNAASAHFRTVDRDKDGKLSQKDVDGMITETDFKKFNPDGDKTLEENEYLNLVEARFNAANPDGDKTIEADELTTAAGKSLMSLLQ